MMVSFFYGLSILISRVVVLIYNPSHSVKVFLFLHILSIILLLFVFLMTAILTGMSWTFSVVLICISLIANDVKHVFHVFVGHLYFFFLRSVYLIHLPIFKLDFLIFFGGMFFELFMYSGYASSGGRVAGKDFLPFCRISLHAVVFFPM